MFGWKRLDRRGVRAWYAAAGMSALLLLGGAAPVDAEPGWLQGEWCTAVEKRRQTCELWGPVRGAAMLGTSQTVQDGKTRDFEFMRIDLSGETAVFHGSPRGGPAVAFRATRHEPRSITFVNPSHDYPQRIEYRRSGDTLTAEISLADGSRAMRWHYRRMR
ncbi:DUF6265 family protein [Sphingomonas sp.]|uniref:DUF6265 family protein n=1 Tax=Sphingomonas sp. TaxID=28214 RepID=UPI002ED8DE64